MLMIVLLLNVHSSNFSPFTNNPSYEHKYEMIIMLRTKEISE